MPPRDDSPPGLPLEPSSPAMRPARPADDAQAQRVSEAIDEELRREREVLRRRKPREVKVMLLGQAESGKSTLQKQFQLYYASHTLEHERPSWRPIVFFNILKAVRMILAEIDYEFPLPRGPIGVAPSISGSTSGSSSSGGRPDPAWSHELAQLRTKLLPLVASEDALASELSGGVSVTGGRTGVFVRAGWQTLVTPSRSWPMPADMRAAASRPTPVTNIVAQTLAALHEEVTALWRHPGVRYLLSGNKLHLEEYAAHFLDDIQRVSLPDYLPTAEDILHVRLQTLGVTEHTFDIDMAGSLYTWLLYDVGGARGQRHVWVPYFEDATAIIFLAPISAFDQYLEEDPRTNRIDDSLQLFTAICSNKLLQKAALVLMLNKTDILRKKLKAGIKVRKFISSYGDRPNSYEEVSEYFRAHFIQVHHRKDISHRPLYLHFTSMIDIKATQSIIINVNEAIMRSHLTSIGLA